MSLAKQGYIREGNIQHAVMDFYRYALEASNLDAADYYYQRVFHNKQTASRICRDMKAKVPMLLPDDYEAEYQPRESPDSLLILEDQVNACSLNELKVLAYYFVKESIPWEIPEKLKIHVDHFMEVNGKLMQMDVIRYIGGSKRNYQMAVQGLREKWK